MSLTDTAIKNAKPKEKPYKLFDGGGLFLLVNPVGSKLWRLKYRIGGREKLLALGAYPAMTLAVARARRDEARARLAVGDDPAEVQKETKRADDEARNNTFRLVADEYLQATPFRRERGSRRNASMSGAGCCRPSSSNGSGK